MRQLLLVVAVFWGAAVQAQQWAPMTGAQISATLTGQTLIYDAAEQEFFASGKTLYNAGQDSWGSWQVRAGQYCSQWPPNDRWDCYDMTQAGDAVRFIGRFGNVSVGRLAD